MKLTFWGAAKTVTGSMHRVETGGKRYLLDCGLYQGRRQELMVQRTMLDAQQTSLELARRQNQAGNMNDQRLDRAKRLQLA